MGRICGERVAPVESGWQGFPLGKELDGSAFPKSQISIFKTHFCEGYFEPSTSTFLGLASGPDVCHRTHMKSMARWEGGYRVCVPLA